MARLIVAIIVLLSPAICASVNQNVSYRRTIPWIAMTTMPTQQSSTTASSILSKGENASEIQSLVARVQWLSNSIDRWNAEMISALVAAAVAAIFIVATTRMAVFRSKQLATTQTFLSDAKDRQAAADSKEKDEKIANALQEAGESNKAAGEANERAEKAQASLASAEQQAAEANAKAEGFRLDIAKANERAAQAQAQVAGAMAEAAKASLELERIKAPHTLSNLAALTESLKVYKGTEYTFSSVFGDEESILLLRQIDAALSNSGWVRVKPPHTYPAINVYGQEQDFAVASGMTSSVKISVDSDMPLATLQAMAVDKLPAPTGAAVALAMALTGSLNPPQEGGIKANVEPGNSPTVRIEVGRKP